jgi:hypothetical protein
MLTVYLGYAQSHYQSSSAPPPLQMILTGFNVLSSCKCIKLINHIHPPLPSHPPFPPTSIPLTGSVLHSCPSLCKCIFIVQRGFASDKKIQWEEGTYVKIGCVMDKNSM